MDETVVTIARLKLGLPPNRFDAAGDVGSPVVSIVCRCIHCGKLFASQSHNLADAEFVEASVDARKRTASPNVCF